MTEKIIWEDYYAKGARFELEKFKEIIAAGETVPMRVIKLFKEFERLHSRSIGEDGGALHTPRQIVDDNLFVEAPSLSTVIFLDKKIPYPPYTGPNESKLLRDAMNLNNTDFDAIVELGSGWGRVLFDLYYDGFPKDIPMYSAEQSAPSREITDVLCELDPAINIEAVAFDFNDPDFSFLEGKKKVFFFTVYSLMFIRTIEEDLIRAMLGSADYVECLHIEPMGYQTTQDEERTLFFDDKNWNANLTSLLDSVREKGKLDMIRGKIIDILPAPRNPLNTASIYHWRTPPWR